MGTMMPELCRSQYVGRIRVDVLEAQLHRSHDCGLALGRVVEIRFHGLHPYATGAISIPRQPKNQRTLDIIDSKREISVYSREGPVDFPAGI